MIPSSQTSIEFSSDAIPSISLNDYYDDDDLESSVFTNLSYFFFACVCCFFSPTLSLLDIFTFSSIFFLAICLPFPSISLSLCLCNVHETFGEIEFKVELKRVFFQKNVETVKMGGQTCDVITLKLQSFSIF